MKRLRDSLKIDTEGNRAYLCVTGKAPTARQISFIPRLLPSPSLLSSFLSLFLEKSSHSLCSLGWLDEFLPQVKLPSEQLGLHGCVNCSYCGYVRNRGPVLRNQAILQSGMHRSHRSACSDCCCLALEVIRNRAIKYVPYTVGTLCVLFHIGEERTFSVLQTEPLSYCSTQRRQTLAYTSQLTLDLERYITYLGSYVLSAKTKPKQNKTKSFHGSVFKHLFS